MAAAFSLRSLPRKQSRSRIVLKVSTVSGMFPEVLRTNPDSCMWTSWLRLIGSSAPSRLMSHLLCPHLIYSGHTSLLSVPQRHQALSSLGSWYGLFSLLTSLPSPLVCLDGSGLNITSSVGSLLTTQSKAEIRPMCPLLFRALSVICDLHIFVCLFQYLPP